MDIHYNYDEMISIAKAMEEELPILIENEEWEKIDQITKIPNEVWSGKAARKYEKWRSALVSSRSFQYFHCLPEAVKLAAYAIERK